MQPKLFLVISLLLASTVNAKVIPKVKLKAAAVASSSAAGPAPAPAPSSSHSSTSATTSTTSTFTPAVPTTTRSTPIAPKPTPTSRPASSSLPASSAPPSSSAPSSVSQLPIPDCSTNVPQATPDPPPACPGCQWPALDKPPPATPQWVALVDSTKIPPAPLNGLDANGDVTNSNGYSLTNDPYCSWSWTSCTRQIDVTSCPPNVWGVTYDDGPQPPSPILQNFLASVQQKATMFVIGSRALEYSQTLLKAFQAGHQIAVHTWSHPYLTTQDTNTIIAEIKWTEMIIKTITGYTPRYFRAPHGDLDDRVRYIVTSLGYKIIQWDHDTEDWMLSNPSLYHFDPAWVSGNFTQWSTLKNQATGLITLEHELSIDSVCEAQKSYAIMHNAQWTAQTVADCLGDPNYYVEGIPSSSFPSVASNGTTAPTGSAASASNSVITFPSNPNASSASYSVAMSFGFGLLGVLAIFVTVSL